MKTYNGAPGARLKDNWVLHRSAAMPVRKYGNIWDAAPSDTSLWFALSLKSFGNWIYRIGSAPENCGSRNETCIRFTKTPTRLAVEES